MEEESTETLARSQLETLYRLGILERSSEDDDASPADKSDSREEFQRHEAFLAALPPPSAVFSMTVRPPPSFGAFIDIDNASSSCRSEHMSGRSDADSLENLSRRKRFAPRRSTDFRSSASSVGSSIIPGAQSLKQERRLLQMWFRQWKCFIRGRREESRRLTAVDRYLKQNVFMKWAYVLEWRRYLNEKKRILDSWKVARAISRWDKWKQRRISLRRLLNGDRSSLMGRLIQQRTWRRWNQFAKRRKYTRDIILLRTGRICQMLLRVVWMELRIHVFRARQNRLVLRRCFRRMCGLQDLQTRQRTVCTQLQQKANVGRKRVFLHRWRVFAYTRGRNRRLKWRVQFDVCRRRYFFLWCEAAHISNRIARLRLKITSRLLSQQFFAWKLVVRAIQLGDTVRDTREKHIRTIYFRAFRDQIEFSVHCNQANLILAHRRLSVAIKFLHIWATERRRRGAGIHRIQCMWQMRLLRRAWLEGWSRIHRKIHARKHASSICKARYFKAWIRFYNAREAYYLQVEQAKKLQRMLRCRRSFGQMKFYYVLRLEHSRMLNKGQEYYRMRLLQKGVIVLWSAVNQNAQNSLRAHLLRQKARSLLRARYFRAWHAWAQLQRELKKRFERLRRSTGYQTSICNPCRRTWNRWVIFVRICQQYHHSDEHHQLFVKRQVLCNWHRQAELKARTRCFQDLKNGKTAKSLFHRWKSHVDKRRKFGVICELAAQIYTRKLCARAVCSWQCWSASYRRIRHCGESIKHQHESKLLVEWFHVWHDRLHFRQGFVKLRSIQHRRQVRACFNWWHASFAQQKAFSRKLVHFQQIFGKYPASSIVARVWSRWRCFSIQSKYGKLLHRKYLIRQACVCWQHWKVFHTACISFRAWQRVTTKSARNTNRLGMRLRCFRGYWYKRLQVRMLNEWKRLVQQRRTLQERQSLYKHQLNRELKGAYWRSRKAARLHLKSWFRRWCTALNKDVNLARNHFRTRLLYNVVLSWWKTTIHSKQERVLVEAKQTIEKLSFYHPQQPAHAVHVDRGDNQKNESRQLNRKTNSKISNDTLIMRCEYMRSRRRMLDPTENPSYSKSYHNSEKTILHSKPSDRSILVQMAKIPIHRITDTRFRHQKSARRVERYPDCPRNNAYESEGERQGRTVVNETNTIAPVGDLVGHAMLQEMNFKNCDEPRANPILLEPSLSLESNVSRESRRRAAKSQSITRKKRVKVIGTSKKETKPLSDILALTSNDGADASFPNSSASKDNVSKDEPMWDSSVIHEIVGSYVDNTLHEYEKGKGKQSRIRTCFELVRDLMLFQNDFYIDELQKVYDDNFKDEFLELPPVVLDVDRREEQYRLELFLEQIVESHPMFRKYVARRSSQTAPLVSALNWLAQYHLRPQLMLQKRARARSKSLKEYWVWEPMPTEMKVSLEKLLPAITKYMRVLGQFFLRQAVQCSSTGDKPQDYRINSSAFINLMKQVCVFPQLFHRRELENAVRLSSCSSPEKEELNFPEFIEALLRCSCNLRWGELEVSKMANGSHNEETVVVIKFAMLIFAMEGQGTVLKKRNEDVNAILAFMGEQQKKKQAEKLFHFRKMLSDTKRRARAIKKPFSVWSQIRLQFPLHTSSAGSPTKSHDTFDELTESWDGGSPRRGSTEPFVFDAQTNQPFGIDMPGPPGEELIDELRNMRVHVRSSSTGSTEEEHGGSCVASGGNYLNKLRSDGATVAAKTVESSSFAGSYAGVEEELMPQQELINSTAGSTVTLAYQRQKGDTSSTDHLSNIRPALSVRDVHQEHQLPVPYQSAALEEPMHKDEFLREILDSIGDVELMLNEPRFVGSNYLKQDKRQKQGRLAQTSTEAVHAVHTESTRSIPSLTDLAADSGLLDTSTSWEVVGDSFSSDSPAVPIRDPMLNYLTDIERFTESADKTSLVSIAEMAELPFTRDAAIPGASEYSLGDSSSSSTWASQDIQPTEAFEENASSQSPTKES